MSGKNSRVLFYDASHIVFGLSADELEAWYVARLLNGRF
jgi:hypothetical protein